MNAIKIFSRLFIFISLLLNTSCLNREFIDGRAELISTMDASLNDSSLIFGRVYRVDWEDNYTYLEGEFDIWLENSDLRTSNNADGFYSIKTLPGTYTIKCQSKSNEFERLTETIEIEMVKNMKTQIDFYIGYTIE